MSRSDPPPASARPTLFGAARGSASDTPLRMLAPATPGDADRRFALRAHRRSIAAAAVLLLAAAAGAIAVDALTHRAPARGEEAVPVAAVPDERPRPAPAAPAVIESIAPAADPAAPVQALIDGRAPATARRPDAVPRVATNPRPPRALPPAPAPADADVDLLAAMVTRLQAPDAAAPRDAAPVPRAPAR